MCEKLFDDVQRLSSLDAFRRARRALMIALTILDMQFGYVI